MATVTFQPTRDAEVKQATPITNYGTATTMAPTGKTGTTPKYDHESWDIAANVPAGATITQVDIQWAHSTTNSSDRTFELMEGLSANDGWTETGATYTLRDGAVAWAGGTNGGAVDGTDVNATALASTTYVGSGSGSPIAVSEFAVNFTITTATPLAVVQGYMTNGRQLHTVLRRVDTSNVGSPVLRSNDTTSTIPSTGATAKPTMTVTYTVGGTNVVPGTLVGYGANRGIVFANTPYTGDSGDVSVFTYAYRVTGSGGSFTNVDTQYDRPNKVAYAAHTPADSDFTGFPQLGVIGLAANTTYDIRVTVTSAIGVTGTATQTITVTTKTELAAFHDTTHYGRNGHHYNLDIVSTATNDTLTDYAHNDYIIGTSGVGSTDYSGVRAVNPNVPIEVYKLAFQNDQNTQQNNQLAYDATLYAKSIALPESSYLHNGSSTLANRSTNNNAPTDDWLYNPADPAFRRFMYNAVLYMWREFNAKQTASKAVSGIFFDNYSSHARGVATDITSANFHTAVVSLLTLLNTSGVPCGGNLLDDNWTQKLEKFQQVSPYATGMVENMFKSWSGTIEVYKNAFGWKADYTNAQTIYADSNHPRLYAIMQLVDASKAATVDSTALRYCFATYMLACDDPTTGQMVYRATDSDNSGYRRHRWIAEESLDWGTPTGAATAELTGTAFDGTAAQWLVVTRTFTNGVVRLNVDWNPTFDNGNDAAGNPLPKGRGATHNGLAALQAEFNQNANNPIPSIASLSPASVTAGSAPTAITLTGASFLSASDVRIGGTTRTHSFVNANTMTVTPSSGDIASAGSVSITVVNPTPGGGTSNTATLTVAATVPVATSLSPSSIVEDTTGVITISGTGFSGATVARLNGVSMPTTFVNATQITFTYTITDVANPGVYSVDVF